MLHSFGDLWCEIHFPYIFKGPHPPCFGDAGVLCSPDEIRDYTTSQSWFVVVPGHTNFDSDIMLIPKCIINTLYHLLTSKHIITSSWCKSSTISSFFLSNHHIIQTYCYLNSISIIINPIIPPYLEFLAIGLFFCFLCRFLFGSQCRSSYFPSSLFSMIVQNEPYLSYFLFFTLSPLIPFLCYSYYAFILLLILKIYLIIIITINNISQLI